MAFSVRRLEIPDIVLIEPDVLEDERGYFIETYKYSDFATLGLVERFVQDNQSRSLKGVLRGLHYQKRAKGQGKLVRVVAGEVFDVAVDIRKKSPTFGKWVGMILSADKQRALYVPPGFAHGFCVLSDVAEVFYKATEEYAPDYERGISWNDPDLGISWPIASPRVSPRDARLPRLREADNDF